ncbi:MAG: ATP-dependent DNA helicase, partial [Patescibacteria group bacterium]
MDKIHKFAEEYSKLNNAQKEAVDNIDGPVMVIAGPGTGKTTVLTLRIANILKKTDTAPENILALTFTDAAATNMRYKLAQIIGSSAYQVVFKTFHSFAENIIKKYPEEFPRIIGSILISDSEQFSILEKLIDSSNLKILRPYGDPFLYLKDILKNISTLKREGLNPEKFAKLVKIEEKNFRNISDLYHEKGAHKGKMKGEYQKLEKIIEKNKELSDIYFLYQEEFLKKKFYDFSDMIMEVLESMQKSKFLLQVLQEEYQYILVDEHQDTNNAQNKIIELLVSFHKDYPNLFIVGDEKQAIFRFQGASLENFMYFKNLYPNAKLITLSENYRSTQNILDVAQSLIPSTTNLVVGLPSNSDSKIHPSPTPPQRRGALKINLDPTSPSGRGLGGGVVDGENLLNIYSFEKFETEDYFIIQDIKKKISEGVAPEEIAILYRNNNDAFAFSNLMKKIGIPHQIESDLDLFSDLIIKKFIVILRAVNNFGDDRALSEFLHLDLFEIEPLDVYYLIRSASFKKNKNLYDILVDLDSVKKSQLNATVLNSKDALQKSFKLLTSWVKKSKNIDLLSLLEIIFKESGLLELILESPDMSLKFDAITHFFDEVKKILSKSQLNATVKSDANLEDFFTYLELIKKHGIFIKKINRNKIFGMVRLMTAHRAKGLEFDYVYIVRAYSGHFGDKISLDRLKLLPSVYLLTDKVRPCQEKMDENSDERRLFYVALTRAKKGITITYSKNDQDGRELLPSSFLAELKPELVNWEEISQGSRGQTLKKSQRSDLGSPLEDFPWLAFSTPIGEGQGGVDPSLGSPTIKLLENKNFVKEIFTKQGFSPTALNNYITCPWKYFYQNLIRIPSVQNKFQFYGIAIHAALQDFFIKIKDNGISDGAGNGAGNKFNKKFL